MKIEEGKFYRCRQGFKIGPMRYGPHYGHPLFPWLGEIRPLQDLRFTDRGFWIGGKGDTEYDLIEEWVDEPATEALALLTPDPVNRPAHYTGHPSGVECIQITEHMNFCRGNAVKYIWRAGEKGNEVQDLEKAIWYLQREIKRIRSDV